ATRRCRRSRRSRRRRCRASRSCRASCGCRRRSSSTGRWSRSRSLRRPARAHRPPGSPTRRDSGRRGRCGAPSPRYRQSPRVAKLQRTMATSVLLLASWLALASVGSASAAEQPAADLSQAKRLFDEGLARYETADYEGAIEVFTLALSELHGQGVDDFAIRGLLRFNIGRAHVRAYAIDHDVAHLRQAQAILRRLLEEARLPEFVGALDEQTIADAEQQLQEIDVLLNDAGSEPSDRPD